MRILLDTNVWRHVVDADAVQRLRALVREQGADIVVAPGVVYEMLRTPDPVLRRRLLKAVTLGAWKKLMTEVYEDCRDVRRMLERRRPHWLVTTPDVAYYHNLQADWSAGDGFWRRARSEPAAEARRLAHLEGDLLDRAREEARERRTSMGTTQYDQVQLEGWTGRPVGHLPGWDGTDVDVWRLMSCGTWWHVLVDEPRQPYLDWIGPFLDFPAIGQSFESWNRLWLHEVSVEELPRDWLRWAVMLLQSVRKTTPGTPADNQIALYAYQADVFLSGDKAIVEIVNRARTSAPMPLAVAQVMTPAADPVRQVGNVIRRLGTET